MHRLANTGDDEVWVGRIGRPYPLTSPFGGADFALMLVVADPAVTDEERNAVAADVVRRGCRYAVCTGHDCNDCTRWDDAVDYAHLATDTRASRRRPSGS